MSTRSSHALAILGPELHARLPETRVLIVGAGGIGCELVKNVVLAGFGHITLLDLDTIDLSNLNRQFLFRKKDVKQSKALVAAKTVSTFNPLVNIEPIHGNIKEEAYDVNWFQSFHIVLNALDNLDARRHVNRMCMAAQVPLIESGTAGYLGQVQPLIKNATECFDCIPKPTPKSFPVCTIRSTPSAPIHCIVWAKSYLFPQLFGEDEDDGSELDAAQAAGENAEEIDNLRKEANAFRVVRAAMLSEESTEKAASDVFAKVFTRDIERLLSMSDMWKSRKPPVALRRDEILSGTFQLSKPAESQAAISTSSGHANGSSGQATSDGTADRNANGTTASTSAKLKDQRELTLKDNVELFDSSLARLAERLKAGAKGNTLSFDKDDDDTLDFVTATANLRAWAYGIPPLTRWKVKEMAGNIIPAIATTNAVISGLIVLQALHVLRANLPFPPPSASPSSANPITHADARTPQTSTSTNQPIGEGGSALSALRNVFIQSLRPSLPLVASTTSPPNPHCSICRETYLPIECDPSRVTLGQIVEAVLNAEVSSSGAEKREVSVYEGGRLLSDPDFDDNVDKTLLEMGCGRGKFLTLVDEDEKVGNSVIVVGLLPDTHPPQAIPYILPQHIQTPPPRPPKRSTIPSPPSTPIKSIAGIKRSAPIDEKGAILIDDDDDEILVSDTPFLKSEERPTKRIKTSHGVNGKASENTKPIVVEEDGVIILD